jgi:hypothetical protein
MINELWGPYWRQYKRIVYSFFFPLIAHFPAQYVFSDAQTHFETAHTYFGAAHYTLLVMLCTSLVYNAHYKSQCYLFV